MCVTKAERSGSERRTGSQRTKLVRALLLCGGINITCDIQAICFPSVHGLSCVKVKQHEVMETKNIKEQASMLQLPLVSTNSAFKVNIVQTIQ